MHLLKRVLTAVVLIPVVVALVLKAPVPVLALVTALVALLSIQELLALSEGYGIRPFRWPTYIFVGLFFLLLALCGARSTPLLAFAAMTGLTVAFAVLAPFLFLTIGMHRSEMPSVYPSALVSAFAFAYVAVPLGLLVQVRELPQGGALVLLLLFIVWAGDIFAYFVGKSLGRHRMAPQTSPKKTWEGAVASLLAGLLVAALLHKYALPISTTLLDLHVIEKRDGFFALHGPRLAPTLLLAAAINVAAQLGDLVESLIKRGAGVKDSGTLLPGHGGMLDRIDALLFAAPLLWYYAVWSMPL